MVRSVTAPSDNAVVPRPESYVSPDDYEPDGPVEIEVALPGSPPPRESLSFSAHYDDVFELSTDSDEEAPDDTEPLDADAYRRIAVDCANAVLMGPEAAVAPPPGEAAAGLPLMDGTDATDAAIFEYCAKANSEKKVEGATWTSVSAGGEDPGREAAHWKEVAEQGFRESARLRAMVQALRSTFEEVEQENEELHVAYAMQQREILTLGHHLEFKTLETETLIANFERAMSEMDDEMEWSLQELQADAAERARQTVGDEEPSEPAEEKSRTDWKAKAAARFVAKKDELAAANKKQMAAKAGARVVKGGVRAGAAVAKLRREVKGRGRGGDGESSPGGRFRRRGRSET